jgi:hypothetical protein
VIHILYFQSIKRTIIIFDNEDLPGIEEVHQKPKSQSATTLDDNKVLMRIEKVSNEPDGYVF